MSFNTVLFLSKLTLLAKEVKDVANETSQVSRQHIEGSTQEAAKDGTIDMKGKLDGIDKACEKFFDVANSLLLEKVQDTAGGFATEAIKSFEQVILSEIDDLTDRAELYLGTRLNHVKKQYDQMKADHQKWFGGKE